MGEKNASSPDTPPPQVTLKHLGTEQPPSPHRGIWRVFWTTMSVMAVLTLVGLARDRLKTSVAKDLKKSFPPVPIPEKRESPGAAEAKEINLKRETIVKGVRLTVWFIVDMAPENRENGQIEKDFQTFVADVFLTIENKTNEPANIEEVGACLSNPKGYVQTLFRHEPWEPLEPYGGAWYVQAKIPPEMLENTTITITPETFK